MEKQKEKKNGNSLKVEDIKIIKPKLDKNSYKFIELENKLICLLVSDPECDIAGVSVNVGVGNLKSPVEREGLAHFLEHMLFLGSKKYPEEKDFSEFIVKNSGSDNAYTTGTDTNYYLYIGRKAFEHAIDMIA